MAIKGDRVDYPQCTGFCHGGETGALPLEHPCEHAPGLAPVQESSFWGPKLDKGSSFLVRGQWRQQLTSGRGWCAF